MNREASYRKLPVSLQHIACSFEGWRIQRTRYAGDFERLLSDAVSRLRWSHEQLSEFRDARLRAFVQHCAKNVPYYRRLFRELGLDAAEIRTLQDLPRIPILTKAEVQSRPDEFLAKGISRADLIQLHTSGTTGAALKFATTWASTREHFAMGWRYYLQLGITRDTWCGYLCGRSIVNPEQTRPPYWRYNIPGKQILFSAYHVNAETAPLYVAELRRRRPPWLHGYPSFLSTIAQYIVESGDRLNYQPSWITVSSENLLLSQVRLIKSAFGVTPTQYYSNTEGVASIAQCEAGNLHVDEDFSAVEFIPRVQGSCNIIGTNFSNYAMPLLRYDIKDIAELSDVSCPCGRPGRVVTSIDGRQEDQIMLDDGSLVGRMDHIFKDMVNIREAQLYQQVPGEIVVRVVRCSAYSAADERNLLVEFEKRLGNRARVRIDYVESIVRERNGKLRFVVSELSGANICLFH